MTRERNLFLAITITDDVLPGEDDPDAIADEIVEMLNTHRQTRAWATAMLDGSYDVENGSPPVERMMVNAIPAPQWLTRKTLDTLVAAARGTNDSPHQPTQGEEAT